MRKLEEDLKSPSLLLSGISEEAILRWMVLLLSVLIGGFAGLFSVLIAQALMSASKKYEHGDESRFGGFVIVSFFYLSLFWLYGVTSMITLPPIAIGLMVSALIIFVFGVYQEMFGFLSLRSNLLYVAVYAFSTVLLFRFSNAELLSSLGMGSNSEWVILAAAMAVLIFSVFAFNASNGMNGLVPYLSVFTVVGLPSLGSSSIDSSLQLLGVGCVIFLMFNVVLGKIYIGTGGAYFLGAIFGFVAFYCLMLGNIDLGYLFCLFFYPYANLLHTIIRRFAKGKALFGDDNGHLDNLIYRKLLTINFISDQSSNLSGLIVAALFCALPVIIDRFDVGVNWWICYVFMWFLYLLLFSVLSDDETRELTFD